MPSPKRLLVFDVEGTLFRADIRLAGTDLVSSVWQAIAHRLGPAAADEEVATHHRWEKGEYGESYVDWMKDTIRIHRKYGLSQKVFQEIISAVQYNDGVIDTLKLIDRSKFEPILITGGFLELASRVNYDFGFVHAFAACNYIFDLEGKLTSYNLLPCDFRGKIDFVQLMLREYGLGCHDWIFVGDGKNDVPIAEAAPVAIGYKPHSKLMEVCNHNIEHFKDILKFLQ